MASIQNLCAWSYKIYRPIWNGSIVRIGAQSFICSLVFFLFVGATQSWALPTNCLGSALINGYTLDNYNICGGSADVSFSLGSEVATAYSYSDTKVAVAEVTSKGGNSLNAAAYAYFSETIYPNDVLFLDNGGSNYNTCK